MFSNQERFAQEMMLGLCSSIVETTCKIDVSLVTQLLVHQWPVTGPQVLPLHPTQYRQPAEFSKILIQSFPIMPGLRSTDTF
jgi:hypothetical protein